MHSRRVIMPVSIGFLVVTQAEFHSIFHLTNTAGLVNGAVVEFYGFGKAQPRDNVLYQPPPYMLVKLLHDPGTPVHIKPLPTSVIPINTDEFTHNYGHGRSVKLEQFPVTLAYAITDYKCQGKTFPYVVVDSKKPPQGFAPASSAYVQLSRAIALDRVSVMRPFDITELTSPLPQDLLDELQWKVEMDRKTTEIYNSSCQS
jgi:hypothetical protein